MALIKFVWEMGQVCPLVFSHIGSASLSVARRKFLLSQLLLVPNIAKFSFLLSNLLKITMFSLSFISLILWSRIAKQGLLFITGSLAMDSTSLFLHRIIMFLLKLLLVKEHRLITGIDVWDIQLSALFIRYCQKFTFQFRQISSSNCAMLVYKPIATNYCFLFLLQLL